MDHNESLPTAKLPDKDYYAHQSVNKKFKKKPVERKDGVILVVINCNAERQVLEAVGD